jgi:hypothetical protein
MQESNLLLAFVVDQRLSFSLRLQVLDPSKQTHNSYGQNARSKLSAQEVGQKLILTLSKVSTKTNGRACFFGLFYSLHGFAPQEAPLHKTNRYRATQVSKTHKMYDHAESDVPE